MTRRPSSIGRLRPKRDARSEVLRVQVEHDVLPLIAAFTDLLMNVGVTPGRLRQLGESALVQEIARETKLQNGRVNVSGVSAITGLARSKVSGYLRDSRSSRDATAVNLRGIDRVVDGWLSDPRFSDANGNPRALSEESEIDSFTDLVKVYGGDSTPRAVLAALIARNRVVLRGGRVAMAKKFLSTEQRNASRLRLFTPVILSMIRAARTARDGNSLGGVDLLVFNVSSSAERRVLEAKVHRSMGAATSALRTLANQGLVTGIPRRKSKAAVTVATIVATNSDE